MHKQKSRKEGISFTEMKHVVGGEKKAGPCTPKGPKKPPDPSTTVNCWDPDAFDEDRRSKFGPWG